MTKQPVARKIFTHPLPLTLIRVGVGGIFLLFGIGKLIAPIEEFYASMGNYQMIPEFFIPLLSNILLFGEIIFAVLLIVGLFTRFAAWGITGMLIMFLIAIGQAVWRGLDLPDCGCSGGLIQLGDTPKEVFSRDAIMLLGMIWLLGSKAKGWGIDQLFERKR